MAPGTLTFPTYTMEIRPVPRPRPARSGGLVEAERLEAGASGGGEGCGSGWMGGLGWG